jgi:hypothetical protein
VKIIKERLRLFEGAIDDVSFKDVYTKKYIDMQLIIPFNLEHLVSSYNDENQRSLDEKTAIYDKDFIKWMDYEYEYHFDTNKMKFESIIKDDNTIDIWRSILVSDEWVNNFPKSVKRLGIFWSFKEKSAEPHWGYNDKNRRNLIKLKSSIENEYVDWIATLRLSMDFSAEGEDEIRLFKNTPIKLEGITVNGKSLDLSKINNKKFLS